jgi:hypothetical protein
LKTPQRRGTARGVHRSRNPNQEQAALAPSSDDDRNVAGLAKAGFAPSSVRSLEMFDGALAPSDVRKSGETLFRHLEIRTFEQVLVS